MMYDFEALAIYKKLQGSKPNLKADIFIATDNRFKLNHYKNMFNVVEAIYGVEINIKTPKSMNIHVDVEEDGKSLEDNSEKKAYLYKCALHDAGFVSMPVVADDSGLFITKLGGFPGLYTRRCAQEGQHSKVYIEKCEGLTGTDRCATYESAFTYISPTWDTVLSTHLCRSGRIAHEIQGTEGNCVENVFIPEELFYPEDRLSMEKEFVTFGVPLNVTNGPGAADEFKTLGCKEMEVFRVCKAHWMDLLSRKIYRNGCERLLMSELVSSLRNCHNVTNVITFDEFVKRIDGRSVRIPLNSIDH